MVQILFVALCAGAATALLFASVASGSVLALLLFYLAPLPILIAALGWSHWAGLFAAAFAAVAMGVVFGPVFFGAFLIGIGLPAWWLGYLALLARPADHPTQDGLDWYPVGRLVVWTALLGSMVAAVGILTIATDADSFRAALKSGFERVLRIQTRTPSGAPLQIPGIQDVDGLLDLLVLTMPAAFAVLTTLVNLINLWLAGHIVKISGRLKRPWPEISAMRFPAFAPALLAVAIALSFLSELVGTIAAVLAACLLLVYAVLGFAVLHAITRDIGGRALLLGIAYAAVLVWGLPVLLIVLIGLGDTALDIRGRVARRRGPPTLHT
jgi:hypothetical protein